MASTDTNFFYNCMMAKALVQLIPAHEKPPIRKWFDRLLTLTNTPKELEIRDEYMWFILMMLQCRKIREPFTRAPPQEIEPIRDLVDSKIYEEILVANGDTMSWPEQSGLDLSKTENAAEKYKITAPAKFYDKQPVPHEGVVCYLAAFSDQRYP